MPPIARAAEMLGEDEAWILEFANEMDAGNGLIWFYGPINTDVIAFNDFGIETVTGPVEIYKAHPHLLKRSPLPK